MSRFVTPALRKRYAYVTLREPCAADASHLRHAPSRLIRGSVTRMSRFVAPEPRKRYAYVTRRSSWGRRR
eukprot:6343819-Pyramimonas_sp.AAC.1